MSTRKVKIDTNPVANAYASMDQRIVEFSSPVGGGLISFRLTTDGYLVVDVYRCDDMVLILHDNQLPQETEKRREAMSDITKRRMAFDDEAAT